MSSHININYALVRTLDLKATAALVVGTVIGTGIFLKAGIMSHQAGSPTWVLFAWVAAGLLSLVGAFCYAELGGMFPRAGGEYVFLREAYGDLTAYLYGWMRFWIGSPGSIAAYGVGAATFLQPLTGPGYTVALALAFVGFFTVLNCFSVATGGRVQTALTVLKVMMVIGLVAIVWSLGQNSLSFENLRHEQDWKGFSSFSAAMIAALWAYDGWNNMPMAAGEVKDPGRTIPKALIFGMLLVIAVYLLVNLTYFVTLTFDEVLKANSSLNPEGMPVATLALAKIFGTEATWIVSGFFLISALGAMNGSVLTGARVPYAMARDGLFFQTLARVHPRTHTPIVAVVTQGLVASVLAMSGSFDQLTDAVVFAAWIFYALCAGAVIVLRKTQPNTTRSYRVPFYPLLPMIFVAVSLWLLINTVYASPRASALGLGFITLGVPLYFLFKGRRSSN